MEAQEEKKEGRKLTKYLLTLDTGKTVKLKECTVSDVNNARKVGISKGGTESDIQDELIRQVLLEVDGKELSLVDKERPLDVHLSLKEYMQVSTFLADEMGVGKKPQVKVLVE